MCFSPEASFFTAGLTGSMGLVSMARARRTCELPLAAVPIFFAFQQAIEGGLWLTLPASPQGPMASGLTYGFLFFALSFWPTYAPLAAISIETDRKRSRLMAFWLVTGAGTSAYFLWSLVHGHPPAAIRDDHIVYFPLQAHVPLIGVVYLASICAPLLLSSRRTVVAFGAIILIGCPVAYLFYLEAFQSVWCFFAAAGSAVILAQFEWARWQTRVIPA